MDLLTTTPNPKITTSSSQDADNETPPLSHPIKSISFTNGLLKKHHNHHLSPATPPPIYRECLKNHAASLGGHALDGCGEFMPAPTASPLDPTSLKCAACGCHRNFHRREQDDPTTAVFLDFRRHALPPPRQISLSPSESPPPPAAAAMGSYYSSAPHMLLALSTGVPEEAVAAASPATPTAAANPNGRKRFRTKFSQDQKEKMFSFSEKLGWKLQKCDEGSVEDFCNKIGVGKGVLKVWMHNNKHTMGRREIGLNTTTGAGNTTNGRVSSDSNGDQNTDISNSNNNGRRHMDQNGVDRHVSTNGSSSS